MSEKINTLEICLRKLIYWFYNGPFLVSWILSTNWKRKSTCTSNPTWNYHLNGRWSTVTIQWSGALSLDLLNWWMFPSFQQTASAHVPVSDPRAYTVQNKTISFIKPPIFRVELSPEYFDLSNIQCENMKQKRIFSENSH